MGIQSVSQSGNVAVSLPSTGTQGGSPAPAVDSVAQAQPSQAAQAAVSKADLEKAVKEIQTKVQPQANNLQFSVDGASGQTVVKVVDSATGSTIRQIPSEEVLAIAQDIDRMQGLLLKDKA